VRLQSVVLGPTETKYGPVLLFGEDVSVAFTTGTTSVTVSSCVVVTVGAEMGASSLWSDQYTDSIDMSFEIEAAI
jgi:hypothetical protein